MNQISTKYDKVEKVINEWDPIDLLPHAPKDEYRPEILKIVASFETTNNVNELAKVISEVFRRYFSDTFKRSEEECYVIAKKIVDNL